MKIRAALLLLCSLLLPDVSQATLYTNTIAVVSNAIVAAMAEEGTVGVSIALVDGPEIVWAQGFGWADREAGIPVDTNTVMMIALSSLTPSCADRLQAVLQ